MEDQTPFEFFGYIQFGALITPIFISFISPVLFPIWPESGHSIGRDVNTKDPRQIRKVATCFLDGQQDR